MKPKIFIGSTKEHLDIAYSIQSVLSDVAYVTPWNQGIFDLSHSALDSLLKAVNEYNYAIFVFTPNDITTMRDSKKNTVRDNVIFELGLFFGKLGKERVYYLIPKDVENFHLPTDLLGITAGTYDTSNSNLDSAVSPFCNQVRKKIIDTYRPIFDVEGYYGVNILSKGENNFNNKEKYSLSVKIPKGSTLKVIIKKIDESQSSWYFSQLLQDNWKIKEFEKSSKSQVFKLIDNDKADLEVFFENIGKALISIYFNNELIENKKITWN